VGLTERINEFLVLIALHMGWDPAMMYYRYCKPTDLHIHDREFAERFPDLFEKLKRYAIFVCISYRLVISVVSPSFL
jgi:hypothetical protein